MKTSWDQRFAHRTRQMSGSAIRELLKLTEQADIISFAGGLPGPDVFPTDVIRAACDRVLTNSGPIALQYGSTEGVNALREQIALRSERVGIHANIENVLITSGSQQALDLLGRIFIDQGDKILVENPTYLGALQAWTAYGAQYITIPCDEDGMIVDQLEEALKSNPKFIYLLPNFQNPTGVTLSNPRRKAIIELAEKYGIPIVEDDPYGQLRYEGNMLPSVLNLDCEYRDGCGNALNQSNVIYLSTYSKILAPGFRLAWVIAPAEVIRKLALAKQGADLHTSTLNQLIAYEVDRDDFIQEHCKTIRKVYKERRDVMLDSLSEFMPANVQWTRPDGGLFLWVTLPEKIDTGELFKLAVEDRVAFVPGVSFHANGGGQNTMRLNFSYCQPDTIVQGIERLGKAVKRML